MSREYEKENWIINNKQKFNIPFTQNNKSKIKDNQRQSGLVSIPEAYSKEASFVH